MSRILRRPMFRGGRVSSYGTGIASGLADGGMPPKRGLVTGPGGYAGWEDMVKGYRVGADLLPQKPTFSKAEMMNFIKQNPGALNSGIFNTTGLEEEEILDSEGNVINTIYKDQENQYYSPGEYRPRSKDELGSWQSRFGMGADTLESPEGIKYAQTEFEKLYRDMLTSPADFDFTGTAGEAEEIKEDIASKTIEEIKKDKSMMEEDIPTETTSQGRVWDVQDPLAYAESTGVPTGVKINQGEVVLPGEDSGIEEMADKYFALMGGDKAWKKDASDMAMLASAKLLKPGATVKSGLGEFMEAESAKGPGRAETIRKDATKFAITQDLQTKLLDKKIDAQKEIADKNLIATIAKLDKDGQYKKKVDDIIDDRFGGDETKRAEASRIALGDHSTIEAAIYDATKGGMPMTPATFDLLAASYTDGPMPTGDLSGMSGTFFVPGKMIIVEVVDGVVDQNSTKDFSGKTKKV